jgi:hypothetical protein
MAVTNLTISTRINNRFRTSTKNKKKRMTSVGFEPTPTKTTALTLRLRPLGHDVAEMNNIRGFYNHFFNRVRDLFRRLAVKKFVSRKIEHHSRDQR